MWAECQTGGVNEDILPSGGRSGEGAQQTQKKREKKVGVADKQGRRCGGGGGGVWGGSKKGAVGVVRKERGKTDHEKPFKLCNLTPTNGQCSADRICGHQIFTRIQIGSMTVLLWYLSRLACI